MVAATRANLVRLDDLEVDGTKLRANASKHRAMSYGRLEQEEKRLQEAIAENLKAVVDEDEAEAKERRKDPPEQGGKAKDLAIAEKRLETVQKAKQELERRAVEREEKRCRN